MKRALVAISVVAVLACLAPVPRRTPIARACAFGTPPTTYETTEDRKLYMQAMDLAGNDILFPHDPFFSQPSIEIGTRGSRTNSPKVYVPPTLLKAISWIESARLVRLRVRHRAGDQRDDGASGRHGPADR